MNYFLDTNVKIGYVFCTDPWNTKSECLFKREGTFYVSPCVVREFNKKYNEILKTQMNFFYSLKDELKKENRSKLLSLNDFKIKSLIMRLERDFESNLKEKIVEVLWKHCESKHEFDSQSKKYLCSINNFLISVGKFIRGLKRKINKRLLYFQSIVIEPEKRDEEYMDLNDKLCDVEIHYPDNCIILDAHDLSLNYNIILQFVSSDNKMIEKANTIIDLLNIDKFHYLQEFC